MAGLFSTPAPTSKYAEERQTIGEFLSLNNDQANKEAQAKKDNEYSIMFSDAYDKVKSDSDNDGKISYQEYKKYIIEKIETKPSVLQSKIQEDNNNNVNQNFYHFDNSLLLAIGIICFTMIITTWINNRKTP